MTIQNKTEYLHKCDKCKKETIQTIVKANILRGVILKCSNCGNEKKRHVKFNVLRENMLTSNAGVGRSERI